jgi:NADH-quinone oxidoreductase subunit A
METEAGNALWPLLVFSLITIATVSGLLFLSSYLGSRKMDRSRDEPYESGAGPVGSARIRFNVQFYLIAMIFIVFDLETMFIVAWAVVFREAGWPGYLAIVAFIAMLVAMLVYLGRTGALAILRRRDS